METPFAISILQLLHDYLSAPYPLPYSNERSIFLAQRCIDDLSSLNYQPGFYTRSLIERQWDSLDTTKKLSLVLQRYRYDFINEKKIDPDVGSLYPVVAQIEITSRCNYRCQFCYQTDTTFSSKDSPFQGDILLEDWFTLIDEANEAIPFLIIASRGEPTLHPHFSEILSYAQGKFLDFKINTNASLLNDVSILSILECCTTVHFSIDSADPSDYALLRVNGDFRNVVKRIKRFNELRDIHPRNSIVRTHASGVNFRPDLQDEDLYKSQLQDLVDGASFVPYTPWNSSYSNLTNEIVVPCNLLALQQYVWFDGTYGACDIDYKNNLISTNNKIDLLSGQGLLHAWKSPELSALRAAHVDGDRQKLTPCSGCTYV